MGYWITAALLFLFVVWWDGGLGDVLLPVASILLSATLLTPLVAIAAFFLVDSPSISRVALYAPIFALGIATIWGFGNLFNTYFEARALRKWKKEQPRSSAPSKEPDSSTS